MIVQLKSVTIRIMAEGHYIEGDKIKFEDSGNLVAEVPLDQVVKISDWGVVVYENTV